MRALIPLLFVLVAGPAPAETAGDPPSGKAVATFAGGCFWCVEEAFDAVDGVESTTSGYTGGDTVDPTYEQVTAGDTGHAEAVRVVYDPERVSYRRLLDVFWHNIDPTVEDRQFCDVGSQYRSAIFFHDEEQRRLARETRDGIEDSGVLPGPVKTEIVPAETFYVAEDYHQNYHRENPIRYKWYTSGCGRYDRLETLWGDKARTG
ncbi:MAG: peptide-methionine (S)-S-oxide reductase MsrA [Halofilum sp. (in: g-proteobacteria)]